MSTTTDTTNDTTYEARVETALHDDWDIFLPPRLRMSLDDAFRHLQGQLGGIK
jgi:hypothetical protein